MNTEKSTAKIIVYHCDSCETGILKMTIEDTDKGGKKMTLSDCDECRKRVLIKDVSTLQKIKQ